MTLHRYTVMTVALFLGFTISSSSKARAVPQGPPQAGYGQQRGDWDAPPQEFSEIQRQGFRDGVEGARKDFGNHRQPNPNNRDEYRKPRVPHQMWDAYREGFRRGYERGMQNMMGGQQMQPGYGSAPMQPPPPDHGGYGMVGGPGREVMLHGFQDGMLGALGDLENHRPPDPNNRDEYRRPNVPDEMQEAYRDGFRQGYERGMALLTGGPDRNDDFRRHAFEDGVAGALKDFGNHRQQDPNNRDEYRSPHVPYDMQEAYRDGFLRGYQRGWSELSGFAGHH